MIQHNTIMDDRQSIHVLHASGTQASTIQHNTMFVASASDDYLDRQVFINLSSSGNATYDYNTYVNPFATSGVFLADSYLDLSQWQSHVGGDSHSTFNGTALGAGESAVLFYNDTKIAKDFDLGGSHRDLDGAAVPSPLALQPFTSRILIKQ